MESQIKSIMKNEIKTLGKKTMLELNDILSHMEKHSLKDFTNIKDEIIKEKIINYNKMFIGLGYLEFTFMKMFNCDALSEDDDEIELLNI